MHASGWLMGLAGKRYLVLIFRLTLAAIFLASSAGKLVEIERYSVGALYDFNILPKILARPFGLVLPFIELLCALGLLCGVLTRLSAFGTSLMSVAFFAAKGFLLLQGRNIDCGCFGAIVSTLISVTIFMDPPILFFGLVVMEAPPAVRNWGTLARFLFGDWPNKVGWIW